MSASPIGSEYRGRIPACRCHSLFTFRCPVCGKPGRGEPRRSCSFCSARTRKPP
uniref:Uncharacterized protein n=1 Tax=Anguilla anguilla TaxID=7936 RepID=A0A0E9WKH7_ANGAN